MKRIAGLLWEPVWSGYEIPSRSRSILLLVENRFDVGHFDLANQAAEVPGHARKQAAASGIVSQPAMSCVNF